MAIIRALEPPGLATARNDLSMVLVCTMEHEAISPAPPSSTLSSLAPCFPLPVRTLLLASCSLHLVNKAGGFFVNEPGLENRYSMQVP